MWRKKKESKRGGSRWESNPGHLWLEPPLFCHFRFPLFSPHNIYIHLFPVWGKMLWAFNQDVSKRYFNCLQKPSFRSEKLNTIQNINHSSYVSCTTRDMSKKLLFVSELWVPNPTAMHKERLWGTQLATKCSDCSMHMWDWDHQLL